MDSKRKANGTATPDSDDRVAKRRKLAVSLLVPVSHSTASHADRFFPLLDGMAIHCLSVQAQFHCHFGLGQVKLTGPGVV
jgi:hypothetical protein